MALRTSRASSSQTESDSQPKRAAHEDQPAKTGVPVKRAPLSIEAAARRDLRAFPPEYRNSAIAKAYLLMARRLDAGLSAGETARLVQQMRMTLLTLNELAPPAPEASHTDELQAKREQWMKNLARAAEGAG